MPSLLVPTPKTSTGGELVSLITEIRHCVQANTGARATGMAIAKLLQPYLGSENLLSAEQMAPGGETYRQHILHVEPEGTFSVVSLVWQPGQTTPIHDHVSWCVVGVHRGAERETVYCLADGESAAPYLVVSGQTINPVGTVAALVPPGDIHHVENGCDEMSVSLHIYGADISRLGSSIRRRYDLEVRR